MRIRVWGCRGSIAVPGDRTIEYGGNTSCVEVRLDNGRIVILDAGTGIRELGKRLVADAKQGGPTEAHLFLTHAHLDHLSGFPFFEPLYSADWTLKVRGGPIAKETVRDYLEHTMNAPFFPVGLGKAAAKLDFSSGLPATRTVGAAVVEPIPLNHPNGGFGFKIIEKGNSFVYLPDNEIDGDSFPGGESYYEYVRHCEGADLVFHDAQYTPKEFERRKGWGHSTFIAATDLAVTARATRLGLFHHDPERSDAELDKIGTICARHAEKKGSALEVFAVKEGWEIEI